LGPGHIELAGVVKSFDGFVNAVDGVNLKIPNGAYCCLLGPSGCGKTTILRMIAGHDDPTAGEILIGGENVVGMPPVARRTAMMFQSYALFPHLSVRDNIAFALQVRGMSKAQRRKAANAMMEKVRLTEFADRLPAQLSGGQQQRVALARAAITEPRVLLLDEPLSALDANLRRRMQTELKSLQREVGITFIFVTHDQEEAMVLSDRIAVIRGGKLQQHGPPMEVYRNPRNLFVASFIGSPALNVTTAELMPDSGAIVCRVGQQVLHLSPDVVGPESIARLNGLAQVLLGIRPTDLLVGGERELRLSGRVFLVEPVGPVAYVDVDVGGWAVKATADPDQSFAVGETVSLGFSPSRVKLFDPATELRL
jgi:ABC-type sugar transport system ATPase subunit